MVKAGKLRYKRRAIEATSWARRDVARRMLIVAVLSTATGILAMYASSLQADRYESAARYVISPSESLRTGDRSDLVDGLAVLDRPTTIATFAELMDSGTLVDQTADDIGLSAEALTAYEVTAREIPGASLVVLSATGPMPEVTHRLVEGTGRRAAVLVAELYEAYEIRLVDSAEVPTGRSSPHPARDGLVAAVLACGLASFALFKPGRTSMARFLGGPGSASSFDGPSGDSEGRELRRVRDGLDR